MKTQAFFEEVARHLHCDARRAEGIVFAVFQEMRHLLPESEEEDLLAQLPEALKRLWSDGLPEAPIRRSERHGEPFLGRIRARAGLPDDAEAERAVRAVFRALQTQLGSPTGGEGEAWDVFSVLPKELKQLWLESARDPEPGSIA